MADFKETLNIHRSTNQFGELTDGYNYAKTQQDLASNTFKVLNFGEKITLGEACTLIDEFSSKSFDERKALIKRLVDNNKITIEEEY